MPLPTKPFLDFSEMIAESEINAKLALPGYDGLERNKEPAEPARTNRRYPGIVREIGDDVALLDIEQLRELRTYLNYEYGVLFAHLEQRVIDLGGQCSVAWAYAVWRLFHKSPY